MADDDAFTETDDLSDERARSVLAATMDRRGLDPDELAGER
jgi:hypothetical protein